MGTHHVIARRSPAAGNRDRALRAGNTERY
jgi:hypothetical protein